jgi:hypothetical protein
MCVVCVFTGTAEDDEGVALLDALPHSNIAAHALLAASRKIRLGFSVVLATACVMQSYISLLYIFGVYIIPFFTFPS